MLSGRCASSCVRMATVRVLARQGEEPDGDICTRSEEDRDARGAPQLLSDMRWRRRIMCILFIILYFLALQTNPRQTLDASDPSPSKVPTRHGTRRTVVGTPMVAPAPRALNHRTNHVAYGHRVHTNQPCSPRARSSRLGRPCALWGLGMRMADTIERFLSM